MFIYILIFRPYKSYLLNFISLVNEALVVINSASFFFFRENFNPLISFYAGWVLIFLLVAVVLFNIIIMLILKVIGFIALMIEIVKKVK